MPREHASIESQARRIGLDDEGNGLRSEPIGQDLAIFAYPMKQRALRDPDGCQARLDRLTEQARWPRTMGDRLAMSLRGQRDKEGTKLRQGELHPKPRSRATGAIYRQT